MVERKYDNAIIRITIPTEEQKENIRKSTEKFLNKVAKELYFNGNNDTARAVKNS